MNVLVSGIGGYVGPLVARALLADGHAVRGFARVPQRVALDVPVVGGDAVTGVGLDAALRGIDVAYFLIHSMEPGGVGDFARREREAAGRFADAARRAGVSRIVYLGGPVPDDGPRSQHLGSRLAVERILLDGVPGSVALRASLVIGAGSRAFRFLVRLVERLPVLILPAWRDGRTRPVDERDVVAMLARCAVADAAAGSVLDAAGPDTVTYGELIRRIAALMLVDRPAIGSRRLTATPIASRIAATIAGEDAELIGPLMASLQTDLLPTGPRAAEVLAVRLHGLDAAIEHALADWERTDRLAAR